LPVDSEALFTDVTYKAGKDVPRLAKLYISRMHIYLLIIKVIKMKCF